MFRRLLIVALLAGGLVGCGDDEIAPPTTIDSDALLEELLDEYRVWVAELDADLSATPSDELSFTVDGIRTTVARARCGAEFGDLPPSDARIAVSGIDGDTLVQLTLAVDDPARPTAAMFELTLTDLAAGDLATIADYRSGGASVSLTDGVLTVEGEVIGIDERGNPGDVVVRIDTTCR